MFPLGNIEKSEVRRIANELGLSIANKKDSTGVCFIGERNFKEFLKNYIPAKKGNIVDRTTNKIIGQHEGVMYYTIGQRKGLGIGGLKDHNNGSWFVVGKNVKENILYVVQGEENEHLLADSCLVSDVSWTSNKAPISNLKCQAKFRYRQPDQEVVLEIIDEKNVFVKCINPVKAITSGQEAVFYYNDECLGGGTIDKVFRKDKLLDC